MTSILTNTSSMVALQTLKSINSNLNKVQNEISTGLKVASAKDNSAIWSVSKVMESDVKGFQKISESLSLGDSTVAVARQAAETITDLLTQMKEKIVTGNNDNLDAATIQADVVALREQIGAVVDAAQFNGLNLVNNSATSQILSSLDRDSAGNVTQSSISATAVDLSIGGYSAKAAFTGSTGVAADNADSFSFSLDPNGGTAPTGSIVIADPAAPGDYVAGDSFSIRVGDQEVSYTLTAEDIAATDTEAIIAVNLKSRIESSGANVTVDYNATSPGTLVITNNDATNSIALSGQFKNAGAGGLGALASVDVTVSPSAALGTIETLIGVAVDAAASFGSVQGRIETQAKFIAGLTDALKSGIGTLVDADMEEASARLQALQVQQQLGIQSLSIANQSPQSILSLFR